MEFPHHHRHHRRDDEDEYPPPGQPFPPPGQPFPPPSYYDSELPPPPPPQVTHVSHGFHSGPGEYGYSPATNAHHSFHSGPGEYGYAPAPPRPDVANVYHISHSVPGDYPPPPPSADDYGYDPSSARVEHVAHISHHHPSHENSEISSNRPSVRMYTKAEENYSLTIRDGKVILAPSDPSDPYQNWIKDERYSTRVKDEEGFPSFALVNKATGQAMKHSFGPTQPVQLTPYNPDVLDESVLWTESRDLGDTFRAIRMVTNIRLNVDAFNGDANHGGVRDGTPIVLWEWKKGDNQRWKIVRY